MSVTGIRLNALQATVRPDAPASAPKHSGAAKGLVLGGIGIGATGLGALIGRNMKHPLLGAAIGAAIGAATIGAALLGNASRSTDPYPYVPYDPPYNPPYIPPYNPPYNPPYVPPYDPSYPDPDGGGYYPGGGVSNGDDYPRTGGGYGGGYDGGGSGGGVSNGDD